MGASGLGSCGYILPRFFEPQSDSKLGPSGPIAVNDPAAKLRGTSSKGTPKTADLRRGRMSPSAAGVACKPRNQRPGKFTCEATKGKGKDDKSWPAPSYLPVRQVLPFDSDSEGARAVIASVEHPQPRIDHLTMNSHYCNDTQNSGWSKSQSANRDEARYSSLAFMRLVEDDLVGSQLSLGLLGAAR
jgi:hypothetical protein